ncbi:DUF6086 family protein [Actinoplanes sp. NPDC049681]|uniref:DUF6086 family protein n=1 Tax=Actinoplanes sp. NPDC049681 TaxID=3363905 RepID=UPI003791CE90
MSQYFQVGDVVLWNPATRVAQLFLRSSEAIAPLVDLPTGISLVMGDEYDIDLDTFTVFVDALVHRYLSSSHPILRSLLEGFTATAIVLVERAGRSVPALTETPTRDPRDVSVGPSGIAALGDIEHLRVLAADHAGAMPV